jgi:OOP family OmpA-OmpF porin
MIRIIAMAAAAWALSAADVRAEDIKGSADHPLVSHYEGARIVGYMTKAFDEYRGIVGPHRVEGGRGRYADLVDLEGTITRILYAAPKGRSTLEIYRNHEQALTGAGFEPIFACKGQECGGNFYGYAQRLWRNGNWIRDVFATAPAGQRYLAARLKRAEGDVYVFGLHPENWSRVIERVRLI